MRSTSGGPGSTMPPTPPAARTIRSASSPRTSLSSPTSLGSATGTRRIVSAGIGGGLPPPPPGVAPSLSSQQSHYSQSIAKSMTIEEMRQLHHRALSEAEAKRTELRLVLASRYRELVGSSDEVIRMKERAQELYDLVQALPTLMQKLNEPAHKPQETKTDDDAPRPDDKSKIELRRSLSTLPRVVHRALDANDVHKATTTLIDLFTLIASQTDAYPLANSLSPEGFTASSELNVDASLAAQIRMIFLQVQTLPGKICRISEKILLRAASYGKGVEPALGPQTSAAALSALDLLSVDKHRDRPGKLLDVYFESKAQLLVSLLNQLTTQNAAKNDGSAGNAESILSKIVLILQHDVIVHPYQIFMLRNFPCKKQGDVQRIMSTLPLFDAESVKSRCSKFLGAHLPLIRTKVKSVLVTIAGTTASALGQIRQSLYDKTDGVECMERLDENGVCTWDEAVQSMVDVRTVLSHADAGAPGDVNQRKFSLWSALFSNTFSSLVHSLLTTSFLSVHALVVSTLRTSLAGAPPLSAILPHEAYRNTLRIATELDAALLKVKEDAHELLVHAEEREESERRLRQSLYVQTCEIMGRLVCELRRMAFRAPDEKSDSTKELIIGRLCYLLKWRLTSLSSLLDANSSPVAMHTTSGMISHVDLKSAFELADDNDDGLITFEEAMEAVESAFSGTPFHGAQMVRDTLLLQSDDSDVKSGAPPLEASPNNVTLNELTLLTARGLRHDKSGPESALGTVQKSLDDIVEGCFRQWAVAALSTSLKTFDASFRDFLHVACTATETEWKRIHAPAEGAAALPAGGVAAGLSLGNVSPFVVGYFLDVASALTRTTCPSDSLAPVPSTEYASSLGIVFPAGEPIPTLMDAIRHTLLRGSLVSVASVLSEAVNTLESSGVNLESGSSPGLLQLHVDLSFIKYCFSERNHFGFGPNGADQSELVTSRQTIDQLVGRSNRLVHSVCSSAAVANLQASVGAKHRLALEASDLFFTSLFGEDAGSAVSAPSAMEFGTGLSSGSGSSPMFRSPLSSTRRFVLLPIQSDRSLNDLHLRGKYAKEKEVVESRQEAGGGNMMSFGFLSSMLKKK